MGNYYNLWLDSNLTPLSKEPRSIILSHCLVYLESDRAAIIPDSPRLNFPNEAEFAEGHGEE